MWKMPENHMIKIPPDQFIQKSFIQGLPASCQFADTDGAKPKMHTQSGCTRDAG